MARLYVVLALLCLVGCRPDSSGNDADASVPGPDAPDGTGCTALTPRSEPPETFIGPTGLEARMTALIDGAKSTLDVQMYLFTVDALAAKLVAAHKRGVVVRVLLDPDHEGNINVTPALTSGGLLLWRRHPWGYVIAAIASIQGSLYLLVLSVNGVVLIHRGLAAAPGEVPVWGTLLVVTATAAVLLLRHAGGAGGSDRSMP